MGITVSCNREHGCQREVSGDPLSARLDVRARNSCARTDRVVVQSQMTICVWELASCLQQSLLCKTKKAITLRPRLHPPRPQTETPARAAREANFAPTHGWGIDRRSHLCPQIRVLFARRSRNSWRVRNLYYLTDMYPYNLYSRSAGQPPPPVRHGGRRAGMRPAW